MDRKPPPSAPRAWAPKEQESSRSALTPTTDDDAAAEEERMVHEGRGGVSSRPQSSTKIRFQSESQIQGQGQGQDGGLGGRSEGRISWSARPTDQQQSIKGRGGFNGGPNDSSIGQEGGGYDEDLSPHRSALSTRSEYQEPQRSGMSTRCEGGGNRFMAAVGGNSRGAGLMSEELTFRRIDLSAPEPPSPSLRGATQPMALSPGGPRARFAAESPSSQQQQA